MLSVIIPALGNVDLTRRCVESVRRCCAGPYEIVLVDNGSTDVESAALAGLGVDMLLSYTERLGYPRAVNLGIQAARGDYVCLLNNDTQVTQRGWDVRLQRILEVVPKVEIVAPVSDFARANGQQADKAQDPGQVHELRETDRVVFVCVMMRRDLFDRIGYLDERFGLGNWEDTDYCYRVRQAGGRIVIDPYVWVRHVGHQTFCKLPEFGELLETNRQLFMEKWSIDDGAQSINAQGVE